MKQLTETKKKKPKEDLDYYKRMTNYYKKRYNDSIEIRKGLVSENIDLIASYDKLDKLVAKYEQEIRFLNRKWWNIFKF